MKKAHLPVHNFYGKFYLSVLCNWYSMLKIRRFALLRQKLEKVALWGHSIEEWQYRPDRLRINTGRDKINDEHSIYQLWTSPRCLISNKTWVVEHIEDIHLLIISRGHLCIKGTCHGALKGFRNIKELHVVSNKDAKPKSAEYCRNMNLQVFLNWLTKCSPLQLESTEGMRVQFTRAKRKGLA